MIRIPLRVKLVSDEETDELRKRFERITFKPRKGFLLDRPVHRKHWGKGSF